MIDSCKTMIGETGIGSLTLRKCNRNSSLNCFGSIIDGMWRSTQKFSSLGCHKGSHGGSHRMNCCFGTGWFVFCNNRFIHRHDETFCWCRWLLWWCARKETTLMNKWWRQVVRWSFIVSFQLMSCLMDDGWWMLDVVSQLLLFHFSQKSFYGFLKKWRLKCFEQHSTIHKKCSELSGARWNLCAVVNSFVEVSVVHGHSFPTVWWDRHHSIPSLGVIDQPSDSCPLFC